MNNSPYISIVVPIHKAMKNAEFFLWRLVQSVMVQTFKDYELVIVQEGSMPINTNAGIRKARGKIIKILYMDDYFAHENALQNIVDNFKDEDQWLASGCLHQIYEPDYYEDPHSPHYPEYTDNIYTGNNKIGSPSVVAIRNNGEETLLFDEKLSYYLDCDLYKRLYEKYGLPKLINDLGIVIGIGKHQTSYLMPAKEKLLEFNYMIEKYGTKK